MWIGDLEEIIARAQYKPNWRMHQTRWGQRWGLAPDNVTIHFGNPNHSQVMDRMDGADEGIWMNNVSAPFVPEWSQRDEYGRLSHGGWRRLLMGMVQARVIKLTQEIIDWLGEDQGNRIRHLGIPLEDAA